MLSESQRKYLTSLHVKKYRQKYRKFLVEGAKIVGELLRQNRIAVSAIFGTNDWATENATLLTPFNGLLTVVSDDELKKVSTLTTPNQVLAVAELPDTAAWNTQPTGLSLYLDGIQDPGNMGTILRIADWFGIEHVFCGVGSTDAYSPKAIQSGMGACLRASIIQDIELQALVPYFPVIAGAVLDGDSVYHTAMPRPALLVIGNEGNGIQPLHEGLLTHRVTIPRGDHGQAESLNAGVATGIIVATISNSSR